jgi:hypothetical protein
LIILLPEGWLGCRELELAESTEYNTQDWDAIFIMTRNTPTTRRWVTACIRCAGVLAVTLVLFSACSTVNGFLEKRVQQGTVEEKSQAEKKVRLPPLIEEFE